MKSNQNKANLKKRGEQKNETKNNKKSKSKLSEVKSVDITKKSSVSTEKEISKTVGVMIYDSKKGLIHRFERYVS